MIPHMSRDDQCNSTQNPDNVPGELRIRIGVSRKPVKRQSPSGVHWKIEHRTVTLSELIELVQSGHALGAICAGRTQSNLFAVGNEQ